MEHLLMIAKFVQFRYVQQTKNTLLPTVFVAWGRTNCLLEKELPQLQIYHCPEDFAVLAKFMSQVVNEAILPTSGGGLPSVCYRAYTYNLYVFLALFESQKESRSPPGWLHYPSRTWALLCIREDSENALIEIEEWFSRLKPKVVPVVTSLSRMYTGRI